MRDCAKCKYNRDSEPYGWYCHIDADMNFAENCPNFREDNTMKIEMPYIEFVLLIEQVLRKNIVVFEDEEYMDIADRIAKELTDKAVKIGKR